MPDFHSGCRGFESLLPLNFNIKFLNMSTTTATTKTKGFAKKATEQPIITAPATTEEAHKSKKLSTKALVLLLLTCAAEAREPHEKEREILSMLNIDKNLLKKLILGCDELTTPDAAGKSYVNEEGIATEKGFKHGMQARTFGTNFDRLIKSLNWDAMLPLFIAFVAQMDQKLTDQEGTKRTIRRLDREGKISKYWKAWDENLALLNDMVEQPA